MRYSFLLLFKYTRLYVRYYTFPHNPIPGYVSAFSIDADTGAICGAAVSLDGKSWERQLGYCCPISREVLYYGIMDSGGNLVQVWTITVDGNNSVTGNAVAHTEI